MSFLQPMLAVGIRLVASAATFITFNNFVVIQLPTMNELSLSSAGYKCVTGCWQIHLSESIGSTHTQQVMGCSFGLMLWLTCLYFTYVKNMRQSRFECMSTLISCRLCKWQLTVADGFCFLAQHYSMPTTYWSDSFANLWDLYVFKWSSGKWT